MATLKLTPLDLDPIAVGLNIEGGLPWKHITDNGKRENKIWANSVIILDRPLLDNILFDDLFKTFVDKKYCLLENVLDIIDEQIFISFYCAVIAYYLDNCHELIKSDKKIKIIVHIHQDTHSVNLIDILKFYVEKMITEIKIDETKYELFYTTDNFHYQNTTPYTSDDADILISLSQCAGVHSGYAAGEILIPKTFIPFSISKNEIYYDKKYDVENHLIDVLKSSALSKYLKESCDKVSQYYKSANTNKRSQNVTSSRVWDYITADRKILHVDGLWNPTDVDEEITVFGYSQ